MKRRLNPSRQALRAAQILCAAFFFGTPAQTGCASTEPRAVAPNESFEAFGVTIQSPVGELWAVDEQRTDDVLILNFSRPEPDLTNTSTAIVVGVERFPEDHIRETYGSREEYFDTLKSNWERTARENDDLDRFEMIDSHAWTERYRGREVLRARSQFKERDNPLAPDMVFILDNGQFVTLHPRNESVGVTILWSRRAPDGAHTTSADAIANGVISSMEFD